MGYVGSPPIKKRQTAIATDKENQLPRGDHAAADSSPKRIVCFDLCEEMDDVPLICPQRIRVVDSNAANVKSGCGLTSSESTSSVGKL